LGVEVTDRRAWNARVWDLLAGVNGLWEIRLGGRGRQLIAGLDAVGAAVARMVL
jgi:hypothetical protein